LPLERQAANLLFALVSRRYERGSIIITSNRGLEQWGEILGDAMVAAALIDRLVHHATTITLKGKSYRLPEPRLDVPPAPPPPPPLSLRRSTAPPHRPKQPRKRCTFQLRELAPFSAALDRPRSGCWWADPAAALVIAAIALMGRPRRLAR